MTELTKSTSRVDSQPSLHQGNASAPVSTLRGAGVGTDAHLAGRIVVGLCMITLAVLAVVFFVAGVHKNDQITSLHEHGVPVTVTIAGCQGLLGGSGSNAAGYACSGTFTLDGHRYHESVPGTVLRAPGSTLQAIAVAGSPPLLDTARAVAGEHTSSRVFVLPAVLLAMLVVLAGIVLLRTLRMRRSADPVLPHGPRARGQSLRA